MIVDQDHLAAMFRELLVRRGYRVEDLVQVDGQWRLAEPSDAIHALVVLDGFDLAEYVTGTLEHLAQLDRATLDRWHRNFTKTMFMLGSPERIASRFDIVRHRAPHLAWTVPGDSKAHLGLRRLLKPLFTAQLMAMPDRLEIRVPGTSARRLELRIARTRTLESYLVHLNHTLCDAFIEGSLRPGDLLTIVHAGAIHELPEPRLYTRVHLDEADRTRLAAHAWLAEEAAP